MAEYKQQSLEQLVDELMSLNDENLAKRVLETHDVQWCLSELYDYLNEDVVKVVRCKNCKRYHAEEGWCEEHSHFVDTNGKFCHPWEGSEWKMFDEDDFCSDGEVREKEGSDNG